MAAKPPALSSVGPPSAEARARPGEANAPSLIARDLMIVGNLICKGEVHIEGEVQGEVHGAAIMIGEHGRLTGGIVADMVIVRGQVMGSIRGKKVMLQSSSHVEGDIYHHSLAIEPGAYFEGKSRRCEDPTDGMMRPEVASDRLASEPAAE
ncbi:MAG TPA: polymer-forming cytoskeletal protein [Hyphomicrobiaceae bacterium]|nr:polymer-forming cytoskeletal protein [Hyphomicrobiaceae bacterium]